MPLCKKCKHFFCINFHDYVNLSLECQCQVIILISAKDVENKLLCEINKGCVYTSSDLDLSNGSNSKSNFELNEKTINSQLDSNDK